MINEEKWQKFWEKQPDLYRAVDPSTSLRTRKGKKYILVEFPYPSGSGLHIGHAFTFTGGDVYARFKRMQGYNVLFPMGWDAFGLPTENYAIKTKRKPQEVTAENTKKFKEQMVRLAYSFDWSREVDTTDPDYYKWTQWIFIQLFKKGLAYKKEMPINWCKSCKTGLANEEVLQSRMKNVCERCGGEVERRNIRQWIVKITDYADKLLKGLEKTDFVEKVKMAQINWIGKSEGARIRFKIVDDRSSIKELEVFTTRPDTIFGATFTVVAPEHPLVSDIIKRGSDDCAPKITSETIDEIKNYVNRARKKSEMERTELNKEKTGVFSGIYAVNPATGKEIPIWISDFVLESYGTGAIMAVPGHDERDFEFAKKFGLPIVQVIKQQHEMARSFLMGASRISDEELKTMGVEIVEKTDDGNRKIEIPGKSLGKYEELIKEKMENGFWNEYINEEIVFIFKGKESKTERIVLNGETEKKIDQLAAEFNGEGWTRQKSVWAWLAENDWYKDYIFTVDVDKGVMVNSGFLDGMESKKAMEKMIEWLEEKGVGERASSYHLRDWIFSRQHYWGEPIPMVWCEKCKWQPVEEKDLPVKLPEVEHYEPTDTGESPLAKMIEWVKTKCPKCGGEAKRETDTMPNWAGSDWYFLRYLDPKNDKAIADKEKMAYWMPVDVYVGGDEHNTLHLLYSRFIVNFLYDIGVVPVAEPYYRRMSHGVILGPDGQRMSKSRGNVIVPDEMVEKWGVDVVRMYLMFMGPFEATMAWNERTLNGVKRFLEKFYKFVEKQVGGECASKQECKVIINKMIEGVTRDMEGFGFNTAVAKLMGGLKELEKMKIGKEEILVLIKLMAPMAPYTAEELWSCLHRSSGEPQSVHAAEWPKVEEKYLREEMITIPVAVNGKVRDQLKISNDKCQMANEVVAAAKGLEKIRRWTEGKKIVKEVYVPGRMVNLVIE